MDLWWYLIAKNNYMFRPIPAIFRLLQFCSKSIINKVIVTRNDDEILASPPNIGIYMILFRKIVITWRWPLLGETCSYFLLLNTIINPYYHSCGFMTDIYLTISLIYTQRGWHTSELWVTCIWFVHATCRSRVVATPSAFHEPGEVYI